MTLNTEQLQELIADLGEFFTLSAFTPEFARLELLQNIATGIEGGYIPTGCYFMDANSIIYAPKDTNGEHIPGITTRTLRPITTSSGEPIKFANLVFYIGEYMNMPEPANALLNNYFSAPTWNERLQNITLPDEIVHPIDRVTRLVFDNKIPLNSEKKVKSGKEITVTTETGQKVKEPIAPIITYTLLDLPPGIQISRKMNIYDNNVYNAVCSLFDKGNTQFTGTDIYRTMTGNSKAQPTQATLDTIHESWLRFTSAQLIVDTGTMGDAYNFKRWIKGRRIIEGVWDTGIVKNQHGYFRTTFYTMLERPILLDYSEALNQVVRYPLSWHNTPINKTPEIIALQSLILDHINAIPAISNHILYETLWEKLNLPQDTPATRRKKEAVLRKHVHKMLDYWKGLGIISNWGEERKNNRIYCITINKTRPRKEIPAPATP